MASKVYKLRRELEGIYTIGGPILLLRYVAACVLETRAVVAEQSLSPADRRMAGRQLAIRAGRATMYIPGEMINGAREIVARRAYTSFPGYEIMPSDTVVDLGCNQGVFSVMAAIQGAMVLSVDAQSGLLKKAHTLALANGCADRVTLRCALVGESTGMFSNGNVLTSASDIGENPDKRTMEQLLAEAGLTRVSFLKIDIEGSEFALLQGSPEWLDVVDRVAMEVHPRYGVVSEIADGLSRRGLTPLLTDPDLRPVREITSLNGGYIFARRS